MALRDIFLVGDKRVNPSGQDSAILTAQVANNSAEFCPSYLLTEYEEFLIVIFFFVDLL